jgi:hypothetical protein
MPTCWDLPIGILKRAGWQKGSIFDEVYFIPSEEAAGA